MGGPRARDVASRIEVASTRALPSLDYGNKVPAEPLVHFLRCRRYGISPSLTAAAVTSA